MADIIPRVHALIGGFGWLAHGVRGACCVGKRKKSGGLVGCAE